METIAFIGLGNMGAPMALNLVSAGFNVQVYDLVESLTKPLTEAGAKVCDSLKNVAEGADVVISMLPAGEHVRS
ncbi:NAD(P)-binding domain-containing protein, partial [Vibrio sp. M260118]|uniref:NAD(P)-binding domain-containing protein n=1 Tax=Vibrio sp. M260118 TaxID=3020896 RepID=UPI002F4125A8